jgi:hypothetical protein
MMFSLQKSFLKIALEVLRVHRGLKRVDSIMDLPYSFQPSFL